MKGVWLREVSFGPDLAESLLGLLRKKYVKTAEGNKGIGQLAKILTAICRGEWLGLDGEFRKVQRVMPVLLVHDRLLESPGFGWFFAQEFANVSLNRTGRCGLASFSKGADASYRPLC